MATINVSIPEPMKDWVEAQTQTGHYSNASEYVRDLIQRDQERLLKMAELQQLIDEGLKSGLSDRQMTEVLAEAREKARIASIKS